MPTPTPVSTAASVDAGVKPFSIDLKCLHMHLAVRVAEVLACAEAMWEWVASEQERYTIEQEEERSRGEFRGRRAIQKPKDVVMSAIRKMSRSDFDSCLSRFEMDMHDNIALDYALEKYLNLRPGLAPGRSAERKSFDAACATWDSGYFSDSELDGTLLNSTGSDPTASVPIKVASTNGRSAAPSELGENKKKNKNKNKNKDRHKDKDNASGRSAASDVVTPRQLCRSFRIFAAWKEG
ncbi:hypothetical protein EW145_g6973 [Phellinidium pouzarii]|uniref:Uncharacterized protein n=1 Tax=Phellinidium pouzarii TaxID=167371 RepID=A0A4S4KR60_9AGAM|nr:hypothetical protein EW145_g6973 [Phellinidium pouzarii]